MKVLLIHPGTQYSFQLAQQLEQKGLLYQFWGGIIFTEKSIFAKLLKLLMRPLFNKIANRIISGIPSHKIKSLPFSEISALNKLRKNGNTEEILNVRNKRFQKLIPDKAILEADIVIGFDTSSWILGERCRKLGKPFILDVSIGHATSKEKIYNDLKEHYPTWADQIQAKPAYLIALEQHEIDMADIIVVPSQFVKNTYIENGVEASRIKVNPFGTYINSFVHKKKAESKICKVVFLFFGALSARKGLPLLLDAWNLIDNDHAELIIAGYGKIPDGEKLKPNVTNAGVIQKNDRQALFERADVFLFPSFFEGFAQVQIEAMACGLPVVGSTNSGASELVIEGVNGFVLETGDKEALKDTIKYFLSGKADLAAMGEAARKTAETFSWENYGERWKSIIEEAFYSKMSVNN